MWVRGLKQITISIFSFKIKSHPMWVRGLKQQYFDQELNFC